MFVFLGPGIVIASVTIGSGELVLASRSGAVFGNQLLWCFVLAGAFKCVQVYGAARHITLTGEHPLTYWSNFPGPPLWFPLLIALPTLAVMPIAFSAISETLAGYIHELAGPLAGQQVGPYQHIEFRENFWGTLILSLCLCLAIASSLKILERVSAFVLGILLTCVIVSVAFCDPDWWEICRGIVWPRVPEYDAWILKEYADTFERRSPWLEIALYLTAVGGGTFDYVGYVGMLREKKWGLAGRTTASREELNALVNSNDQAAKEQLQRARQWTRAPLLDATSSFGIVILVTLLFAILGAEILNEQHSVPDNSQLLSQQETFLTILHPQLKWIYRGGVFLAFIGTLYGAFEVYKYTFIESIRAFSPRLASKKNDRRNGQLMFGYCYIGGLTMIWLPQSLAGNVVDRMTFGAVIGGATLCGLWCFAMLWTDAKRLPKPLRMGPALWWSTLIAGVVMTGLGSQTLLVYFSD